ncbi:MAG: phosphotransferase, partial [Candidatus Rokuibacteriota bacterium]
DAFGPCQRLLGACAWADAESRAIQIRRGPQHNDLHGLNVLVDDDRPAMIDFAEVGESPIATDPLTLELSNYFHPRGVGCSAAGRAQILAGGWWTGAPDPAVAPFVQECRQWAQAIAAGDRERLACAYSYAVRQLKYDDTDKDVATAIACAAVNALLATF